MKATLNCFQRKNIEDIQKQRRRVGCIIEAPSLYPSYTAYQNMKVRLLNTSSFQDIDEETIHLFDYLERSGTVCLALAEEGIDVKTIESKG